MTPRFCGTAAFVPLLVSDIMPVSGVVEEAKKVREIIIKVSEHVECMGLGCWMISVCSFNEKVISKAQ